MKANLLKLLVLLILSAVLVGGSVLTAIPLEGDRDDYGRLIGQVIDPESGAPVNERFVVKVLHTNEENPHKNFFAQLKTDDKGFLSKMILPGTYYLCFSPESSDSKYSFEPYPYYNDKYKFFIKVESGKISRFTKKATLGGSLKLVLVNSEGKAIDPLEEFQKSGEILVRINSPNMFLEENFFAAFKNGEEILSSLYPDTYNLTIDLGSLGLGINKEISDIKVTAMTQSEAIIKISLDQSTAVEGQVFDNNGVPIHNAKVIFIPHKTSIPCRSFKAYTDATGKYNIRHLPDGIFRIMIVYNKKGYLRGEVEIKRQTVTHKNISL